MKKIHTDKAPQAVGPYSQAVVSGGMVYTSGQIAINPATNNIEAVTIEEQSEQVMQNLKAVLEASGSSFDKAVKTTCFLADMNDFGAFNGVYGKYFTS
ncbi:MAG: Rid family detoxifying hydrolase, partial [Ruminococcus sp.]|nr:Rid family detoxifying hydrolase [Ruminococcus sp.]